MPPPFVLMYHSVSPDRADPHQITVSPDRFARQMSWLDRRGLRGTSMRTLMAAADRGATAGLVGLTFDDGYADFLTHALPVLSAHGFGATAFVVAGKLGGHNDWDSGDWDSGDWDSGDRDSGDRDDTGRVPAKALMTAEQVREIRAHGVEIGSHGLRHRSLRDAGPDLLHAELQRSKEILEQLLQERVCGFCYPYGELSDRAVAAVAGNGYDYAVATRTLARPDRHALPRTYVGERDRPARLWAKQIRHRLTWAGRR